MTKDEVLAALAQLGTARTKKTYMNNGAQQPLDGVPTGAMKPLLKQIGINQALAEELYATNHYDAMYFAGMIADPNAMTAADFQRWIEAAYFYMLSDYVVAVTLAEAPIAQDVADAWIASGKELHMSAGWSCYCWLLGSQQDALFSRQKLQRMVDDVKQRIHTSPPRTQIAMKQFIVTVAVSYKPLFEHAYEAARAIGTVTVQHPHKQAATIEAVTDIEKAIDKQRIGFKRKHVRC